MDSNVLLYSTILFIYQSSLRIVFRLEGADGINNPSAIHQSEATSSVVVARRTSMSLLPPCFTLPSLIFPPWILPLADQRMMMISRRHWVF